MSLKRHGKANKPNSIAEHPRLPPDYPSREELMTQLSQLRSSLDGAYETLDSLAPSADPEVIHKVADMVDIINGLHECEFELMDLLAKDSHVISPAPSRGGGDNPVDNDDERLCDGAEAGENEAHSRVASQEDLSLYGAYAVSSSRAHKTANEMSRPDKSSDHLELAEKQVHIPAHERADYIKRLEEIQKVNERLVERCRRLGLVLRCGFALDKNFTTKIKEVKDIIAAKDQAQRKILELKALMAQVAEPKVETNVPVTKFENDETYGKPFPRFEPRGASSLSPDEHVHVPVDDENLIKKPRSYLGFVESSEASSAPDYAQFLRGLSQPFVREHGERESAFVPIHNASHLDSLRDKNKRPTNLDSHGDLNNDVKHLAVGAGVSMRRMRDMDDGHSSSQEDGQTPSQWDQQRLGRSSSARSALAPPPPPQNAQQSSLLQRVLSAANNNNTLPNNLYRVSTGKSPISLQSSSGMGSMNSRSLASIDNCRNDLMMSCNISRAATRNQDPDDNIGQRGFSERSNNLNKPFRQPTRSSSFYSELDFRNQEFLRWDDDRVNTTPCPSPPFRDLGFTRRLSTTESQQITDELNRVRRYRNVEETLPQQNWWGSGADLGHSERQSVLQDHQNFMQRGKSALNEKQPIGNTSYCDLDALLYEPFPNVNGQRTTSDCYTQNMQLSISIQELSQQIRNLNAAVSANKAATRDALMQQRFDLHNMTRNIRDVSDMISESTKRIVTQISSQTRLIVDIEARLRRLEDNQRVGSQKISTPRERERDWQVPGRPDVMLSQELPFQFGVRDPSRETDNGTSNSMLNNQIPPGTRANNYWDNFRSYSRQNMLSKSNANVHQTYSHEPSPSAAETTRYSTEALNHSQLYTDVSPGSLDSGRRNGGVKNSWATSGFYENMSSKKRNKDQKSQSTFSSTSKVGSSTQPNSTVPESLHTSHTRDAHPEPDENRSTPTNRQQLHSILSPRLSPFRREPEPRRYSHFSTDITDLYWPQPSSEVTRKANFERDMNTTLFRGTDRDRESSSSRDMLQHRDVHLEENNPNSQSSASKIEREKHIQKYEQRASDGFISLDDTRSTNQEVLDTTDDNTMPDWATSSSRHDESSNTLEGPSSTGDYRSPLSSPLLRHVPDNIVNDDADQTDRSNEGRGVVSPPNLASHSDVPLNIRCEESNALENSLGRSTNRSDTSGSNNL